VNSQLAAEGMLSVVQADAIAGGLEARVEW
jgi:hypothetical protein